MATPTGRCDTCRLPMPFNQREYQRAYREANKERLREQNARWRAANRETIRERQKRYRADPAKRERKAQLAQAQYAVNREQKRAAARDRYWAARDQRLASGRRRRHGVDDATWAAMWNEQDGRCYLCRSALGEGRATVVEHWHGCRAHDPNASCKFCQRGLACRRCNLIIGQVDESADLLRLMASSLEAANAKIAMIQHQAPQQLILE